MKRYIATITLILLLINFNSSTMETQEVFAGSMSSALSKVLKISFLDALIKGEGALKAQDSTLFFDSYNTPLLYSCDLIKAHKYIEKLTRKNNRSRGFQTSQIYELSILLDKDLSNEEEETLLDLQKKRFADFLALQIPQDDKEFFDNLHNNDAFLSIRLEEQLGGTVPKMPHNQVFETIKQLAKNRATLLQAIADKNAQSINETSLQPMQLHPLNLNNYITMQCKKYIAQLQAICAKFNNN